MVRPIHLAFMLRVPTFTLFGGIRAAGHALRAFWPFRALNVVFRPLHLSFPDQLSRICRCGASACGQ